MITFKTSEHTHRPNTQIVQILFDGKVVGAIYPEGDKGVKIVSAHFKGTAVKGQTVQQHVVFDEGVSSTIPIPSISMTFEPAPYEIKDGRIVRIDFEKN